MFCWNVEGVRILTQMTTRVEGNTVCVRGAGDISRGPHRTLFTWEAIATDRGWQVEILAPTGRVGLFQGSTFNLPLEVASASRRLL